jgi:hypothetical protein
MAALKIVSEIQLHKARAYGTLRKVKYTQRAQKMIERQTHKASLQRAQRHHFLT